MLFVVERLSAVLDERRLAIILRQHSLGKPNGATEAPAKLLSAFFRKTDEGTLGRLLVVLAVLQAAASPNESRKVLHKAAVFYEGGCGSHHNQSQAGIRHEGQGEGCEDSRHAKTGREGHKETHCGVNRHRLYL